MTGNLRGSFEMRPRPACGIMSACQPEPVLVVMVWVACTVGCWDSGAWLLAGAASLSTAEVSGGIWSGCHQVNPVSEAAMLTTMG